MLVKPDVDLNNVHSWMHEAAQYVDWVQQYLGFGDATITGGREPAPRRVRNTLHARGMALDFRATDVPTLSRPDFARVLQRVLAQVAPGIFQVFFERNPDHFHIELSPAAVHYVTAQGIE